MTPAMRMTDKTLKEVLDALIERDLIPSSRVGPIKTAVKQYALILGYSEPAQCPLSAFHLQDQRRNHLIELVSKTSCEDCPLWAATVTRFTLRRFRANARDSSEWQ